MTTVLVLRHGETTWNRERRIQGWAPTRLTDLGRDQADAAGAHIAREYGVDRIHASDLQRTRETVELIRDHGDPPVEYDTAWRERNFGVCQGLDYDELFSQFPELRLREGSPTAAERAPEGGESLLDLRDRVLEAWSALLTEIGRDETRLLVTHGGPIHAIVGHVEGLDVSTAVLEHDHANCSLTEMEHDPETGTKILTEWAP